MNKRAWTLVGAGMALLIAMGCSREPSVEQEVVAPPAPMPKVAAPVAPDAGQVGSSHQQEAHVKDSQPAASSESTLKAIPGFRVTQALAKEGQGTMHFLMPEDWKEGRPASSMRIFQVGIPPAEGDTAEGEIAFFAPIGGSVEDNINRWIGQFSQPDGSDSKAKSSVEDVQGDQFKVKMVSLTGTMLPSSMPGMAAQPERAGWMMLGAIIETPSGPWYIKATGPEKTLTQAKEKFMTLCKSVQIVEGSGEPGGMMTHP
jgi:hypothetical protein